MRLKVATESSKVAKKTTVTTRKRTAKKAPAKKAAKSQ